MYILFTSSFSLYWFLPSSLTAQGQDTQEICFFFSPLEAITYKRLEIANHEKNNVKQSCEILHIHWHKSVYARYYTASHLFLTRDHFWWELRNRRCDSSNICLLLVKANQSQPVLFNVNWGKWHFHCREGDYPKKSPAISVNKLVPAGLSKQDKRHLNFQKIRWISLSQTSFSHGRREEKRHNRAVLA